VKKASEEKNEMVFIIIPLALENFCYSNANSVSKESKYDLTLPPYSCPAGC